MAGITTVTALEPYVGDSHPHNIEVLTDGAHTVTLRLNDDVNRNGYVTSVRGGEACGDCTNSLCASHTELFDNVLREFVDRAIQDQGNPQSYLEENGLIVTKRGSPGFVCVEQCANVDDTYIVKHNRDTEKTWRAKYHNSEVKWVKGQYSTGACSKCKHHNNTRCDEDKLPGACEDERLIKDTLRSIGKCIENFIDSCDTESGGDEAVVEKEEGSDFEDCAGEDEEVAGGGAVDQTLQRHTRESRDEWGEDAARYQQEIAELQRRLEYTDKVLKHAQEENRELKYSNKNLKQQLQDANKLIHELQENNERLRVTQLKPEVKPSAEVQSFSYTHTTSEDEDEGELAGDVFRNRAMLRNPNASSAVKSKLAKKAKKRVVAVANLMRDMNTSGLD